MCSEITYCGLSKCNHFHELITFSPKDGAPYSVCLENCNGKIRAPPDDFFWKLLYMYSTTWWLIYSMSEMNVRTRLLLTKFKDFLKD